MSNNKRNKTKKLSKLQSLFLVFFQVCKESICYETPLQAPFNLSLVLFNYHMSCDMIIQCKASVSKLVFSNEKWTIFSIDNPVSCTGYLSSFNFNFNVRNQHKKSKLDYRKTVEKWAKRFDEGQEKDTAENSFNFHKVGTREFEKEKESLSAHVILFLSCHLCFKIAALVSYK